MSCDDGLCGTGDYSGPKPGDPSNALSLSANAVYGGINVSWSYPTLNPHAVAHTLLYRGVSTDFSHAMKLAVVAGSMYYDQIDSDQPITYYYWIEIVSVNGTIAAPVGPASTTSVPRAQQTLESLTGLIDAGVLAQALKTQIGGITIVDGKLADEIQNRINSNAGLAEAISATQSGLAQALTYVQEEITQRTEGDSALVQSLTTLASTVGNNFSLFQNEQVLRTTKDTSYANNLALLFTKVDTNAAAVKDETKARISADSGLASRVTTTEVSLNGNTATGEVGLTSKVGTLNGKVADIGALYTAKLSVNGLIGGFGVYNNGAVVDAGFDVDKFWVGRTGPDKVKPFIIDQGIVYIDKARIRNADIDRLKISGNSVTVPKYAQGGYFSAGSYERSNPEPTSWATVLTLPIQPPEACPVIIAGSVGLSHTNLSLDSVNMRVQLLIDGAVVVDHGGQWYQESVALNYGLMMSTASHIITIRVAGNSGLLVDQSSLFAMAAMR